MLPDEEVILMLASCGCLVDLRLKGCTGLGDLAITSIPRSCRLPKSVDITHCYGVEPKAVKSLLLNLPRLKQVQVEEGKALDVLMCKMNIAFIN